MILALILAAVVVALVVAVVWWRTCRTDAADERAFEVRLDLALSNLRERDAVIRPRSIPDPAVRRPIPGPRHRSDR